MVCVCVRESVCVCDARTLQKLSCSSMTAGEAGVCCVTGLWAGLSGGVDASESGVAA